MGLRDGGHCAEYISRERERSSKQQITDDLQPQPQPLTLTKTGNHIREPDISLSSTKNVQLSLQSHLCHGFFTFLIDEELEADSLRLREFGVSGAPTTSIICSLASVLMSSAQGQD